MFVCLENARFISSAIPSWFLSSIHVFPKKLLRAGGVGITLCAFACVYGQSSRQILDIAQPTASGILGHVDTGALAEVSAHFKAVGSMPWTGMQGTGQITYGTDGSPYSATLTILGNTGFRLDALTPNGQLSIRISGTYGKILEADGHQYPILPDTAASGIFQFQMLRLANFPKQTASLIDHGDVLTNGQNLHRVTFEFPVGDPAANKEKQKTVATDFYFDPTSHLLVKSANTIHINGAGNNDFLREITYGDYRQVGSSLIPFRYTQTLNGQQQWVLQLSEVQLDPTLQAAYFTF